MSENFDLISVHSAEPRAGIQVGPTVLRTHPASACSGQPCCIHAPSDHPLSTATMNWRADRNLMERICDHGVGHPDPDDIEYKRRTMHPRIFKDYAFEIHGCDGCCKESNDD